MPSFPLMNQYWDDLADIFTFNHNECCLEIPHKDETVLHIRGFDVEMPQAYDKKGWRELDPIQTSNNLLQHLNAGDKVAIIGRFPDKIANFTATLQDRGLQVRSITNQNGVQDFCFLKSATKEIIGGLRTTFFRTAALLNDQVANVTIYCYNQPPHSVCGLQNSAMFTNKWQARKTWNYPVIN